ncbi:MAG TPA: SIMPL domain-containing protein [Gemmatimonadaceae bacterium]
MQMDRDIGRTLILGAAIIVAGALVGYGLTRVRAADHYVTVKGVAERAVRADLAIWPLHLVAASDDLAAANAELERSVAKVRAFLARHRIDTSQVSVQGFSVADAATNQFGSSPRPQSRYVIRQTLIVRSTNPDAVLEASQHVTELVAAGVVLSSGEEYGPGGPTFVFSGLNTLKPAMIGEATARAREGAEQFARDSHASVGGILRASQGVFEILPRDQAAGISEASQVDKTVRVVSTIDFALDN